MRSNRHRPANAHTARWVAGVLVGGALLLTGIATAQQPVPTAPETVVEAAPPEPTTTTTPDNPSPLLPRLDPFRRGDSLLRSAPAASEGNFGQEIISIRPQFSPTSVLDSIPGFASVQENTGSDAGVYFVRGVNTEHGYDFAIWVDDMPLNMPTHAHAQGLANMNFLIPELIQQVDYRKGSYYADLGDFSSLGAAKIELFQNLPQNLNLLSAGEYSWVRALTARSVEQWGGELIYAADVGFFDDGWDVPQRNQRYRGMLKHTIGDDSAGVSNSLMAYYSNWYSTDAQPLSAIQANGLYSNLDPTTGGRESRFSWNTQMWREDENGAWKANAYVIYDRFGIWINPEQIQDEQVYQPDGRVITGFNLSRREDTQLGSLQSPWTFGLQFRNDNIDTLRRDQTDQRNLVAPVTNHRVNILTVSPYIQNDTRWTDWARTVVGLRSDLVQFDVNDRLDPTQSGDESAGPVCPKFSLILGPWDETEYYFNFGTGYHSNDARNLFNPTDPVVPIAGTMSTEVGLRSDAFDNWKPTVAVWYQEFDSELVFNAEEGEVEALGPSRRYGVEWNNRFFLTEWMMWDVNWAWAHVRFTNGDRVPQSLSSILQTGPTIQFQNGVYSSLWYRYLSPAPLDEAGSIFSNPVSVAQLSVGWRNRQWQVATDVFNVFGSRDYALTFAEDELFVHPVDPQQVRFSVTRYF